MSFSVWFCWRHAVSRQGGALDRLLHQARGLGLFDELADVGESLGSTLRHHHADEVGPVVVLQHPRAGKLCGIRNSTGRTDANASACPVRRSSKVGSGVAASISSACLTMQLKVKVEA